MSQQQVSKPHAPRGAQRRLDKDRDMLMEIIWRHQETQRLGAIEEPLLHYLTGWGHTKFRHILDKLIEENPCVIRCQDGRIAYTW